MGQAAQQQQQGSGDNSLAPLWITILVFFTVLVIWHYAHGYIVSFVFAAKTLEAEFIRVFLSNALSSDIQWMQAAIPDDVDFDQMASVSEAVGNYFRYPAILLLGILASVLFLSHTTLRYRKTYSMKKLLDVEYPNWPQVTPVVRLNLLERDIDKGPWSMALTPMQFAKKHNLLIEQKAPRLPGQITGFNKKVVSINRGEAKKLFALQIGPYWRGPRALSKPARALFAIFAARINSDRDAAHNMVMQIASSTEKGKLDFSGVNALLMKHYNSKPVQKVIQAHAFELTVMAAMLERARMDGVLATADFLWLKPVDRRLWYMLNSVGRQTAFVEVAGPFAHLRVEDALEHRLIVPMIDEAATALEVAIQEILYEPEE